MSAAQRWPVERQWPVEQPMLPRTVVVRFGETPDGQWWASLPDRRQLHHRALGALINGVDDNIRRLFPGPVRYELLRVETRRRQPAGQAG